MPTALHLGSPDGRAGAKRLRGLTAPIPPTNHPQTNRTDPSYETASHHLLSAHPSPPPFGRYLSRRERQELSANFKQLHKPGLIAPSTDAHCTLGSPSGRAGAKRLRGLTALILPTIYPVNYCTDSIHRLSPSSPQRFLIRSCTGSRTVCTSLSPSLREVPLPEGEARAVCGLKGVRT